MLYEVVESKVCDSEAGIISDEIIKLTGVKHSKCYLETLKIVTYEDFATGKVYRFLYNRLGYEALTIAELYRRTLKRRSVLQMDKATSSYQVIL